jgi:hypothetical protein
MRVVFSLLMTGLLLGCVTTDESRGSVSKEDAGRLSGPEQSAFAEYCGGRSCPSRLAAAVESVKQCVDELEFSTVVEFDDGTVCVGFFDGLGAFGTCYRDGVATGVISYSDQMEHDDGTPPSSVAVGDLGISPFCASRIPESGSEEDCDPRPIARCLSCALVPEDDASRCTEEYLDALTMPPAK